ncbi:hypothetical protein TNCT_525391 [Trichonephila clavata]|uniref:Uncharacterized protein n=1 Tax=Trichonephila clavata TaxID=2740835 RepID=A0A8X6GGE6_TRICU|nr:hypothetical protein TNCT_525391 [Trichonephila clavata]
MFVNHISQNKSVVEEKNIEAQTVILIWEKINCELCTEIRCSLELASTGSKFIHQVVVPLHLRRSKSD